MLSAALWQRHTEKPAAECPKPVQKVLALKEKHGDKKFYQVLLGTIVLLCLLAFMGAGGWVQVGRTPAPNAFSRALRACSLAR